MGLDLGRRGDVDVSLWFGDRGVGRRVAGDVGRRGSGGR